MALIERRSAMRSVKWLSLATLSVLLFGGSCVAAPTSPPSATSPAAISREKAIAIAATQVPPAIVERSIVQADDISGWRVSFQQANVTKDELAWPDDGKNTFQSEGSANVPPGIFATVVIIVSPLNGDVIDRIATNSILLGLVQLPPPTVRRNWWNGWSCSK